MQFSERTSRISISPLTAVFQQAQALKARGAELLDFGAGEPDFPTPEHIKQAAVEALRQVEARLIGVVMNKISKQRGSYYYYYYYYDSGDGEKTVRKRRRSQRPLHRFFPLNLFKRASKPTVASPHAGPQQEGPA
jgi:hypothetical protein